MRAAMRMAWILVALGGLATWGAATGVLNPRRTPALEELADPAGALRTLRAYDVDYGLLGDQPPDAWSFRRIGDGAGHEGLLYVAYFERGRRWSGRPHELSVCYRANGWTPIGAGQELRTSQGARAQVHRFERDGDRIRVIHWVQTPGLLPGSESFAGYLRRIFGPARLRQDVASVYLEFPDSQTPGEAVLQEAVGAWMVSLEALWGPG